MDAKYYEIGPGFWGFLVAFVLAVAVIVIYRSMSKHLRKVRKDAEVAGASASVEHRDGGGNVVAGEAGDR